MHQELAEFYLELLKHPVYSPDLALLDYYLFPNLNKHVKGRKFSSIEETIFAADGWFCFTTKIFFWVGYISWNNKIIK
jgi:hypothetical protein